MSYLDLSLIMGPFLAPVQFWTSHRPLLLPSLQPHQPYSLCSWNIAAHPHFIVSVPTLGLHSQQHPLLSQHQRLAPITNILVQALPPHSKLFCISKSFSSLTALLFTSSTLCGITSRYYLCCRYNSEISLFSIYDFTVHLSSPVFHSQL